MAAANRRLNFAIADGNIEDMRHAFSNQFNIERRGGRRAEIVDRLLGGVGFRHALIAMHHAQQAVAQALLHKGGDVAANVAAVVALVQHEVVPQLIIQRLANHAVIFNLR